MLLPGTAIVNRKSHGSQHSVVCETATRVVGIGRLGGGLLTKKDYGGGSDTGGDTSSKVAP